MKSRGLTCLYLAVDQKDTGVQEFYKRLGFENVPADPYPTGWTWTDSDGVVQGTVVWIFDMVKEL